MEAKTKIIAAVAVIVMCAAGLVGAGYAYTASTVNDNNDISSEYIVINQNGAGKYNFANNVKVQWSSYDYNNGGTYTTLFYLAGASTTDVHGANYDLLQVGNAITLESKPSAAYTDPIDCVITGNNIAYDADAALFIKAVVNEVPYWIMLSDNNTFKHYDTDHWAAGGSFAMAWDGGHSEFYDVTLTVYVGYLSANGGVVKTHVAGTHPTFAYNPMTSATLMFTLDTTAVTAVTAIAITGGNAVTVGGDDLQLTATITPDNATNKKVIWSSSNTAKATVDGTGKVHAVEAGSVTITAISADGAVIATKVITVNAAA